MTGKYKMAEKFRIYVRMRSRDSPRKVYVGTFRDIHYVRFKNSWSPCEFDPKKTKTITLFHLAH